MKNKFETEKLVLCLKMALFSSRNLLVSLSVIILFLIAGVGFSFAQFKSEPKIGVPPVAPKTPLPQNRIPLPSPDDSGNETPSEKYIATDEKVNVQLCVTEGNVKINGWDRNEIRAFVDGGSGIEFKVLQFRNQNPVWVKILGHKPQKSRTPIINECLSGNEIEIDVPRGAVVDFTGQETDINIQSVSKVLVKNIGGNIFLNDIMRGITAKTYEGTVTVENSRGSINLNSTTGNIVAFDTQPAEIADSFTAKTNSGVITMQQVSHRLIDAGSNSGSIKFSGEFSNGGQYNFVTTNGSINLFIPADSSCKIKASYGGVFQSDIPLKDVAKTSAQVQSLSGTFGRGDANLVLTTFGGAIHIRKQ